jgi:hypothetical protein
MIHRNFNYSSSLFLFLFGMVSLIAFPYPISGEEKGEADRVTPSKITAKKLSAPNLPNYEDVPLGKAILDIAKKADVKITIDPKALEEEGITEETPITLRTKHEIMLKSTLNLILDPLHLMYEINGAEIIIISDSQYDSRIITKKYSIADMAVTPTEQKVLLEKLRKHAALIAPKGTFNEENLILSKDGKQIILEQTWSVHEEVMALLKALRYEKDPKNSKWVINRDATLSEIIEDEIHNPTGEK